MSWKRDRFRKDERKRKPMKPERRQHKRQEKKRQGNLGDRILEAVVEKGRRQTAVVPYPGDALLRAERSVLGTPPECGPWSAPAERRIGWPRN